MMRKIFLTVLGAAALGVSAQGLHQEITVEQEIIPSKRDASRITVLPAISLPPLVPSTLSFSDRTVTTSVPASYRTLAPVAWGDGMENIDTRGYVDLLAGGPRWDGALSAGYRILDNDRTRLSVWGQYDGDVYQRQKSVWKDHTASLGVDFHCAPGRKSVLDAGVSYTYGYHNGLGLVPACSQSASQAGADVTFYSSVQGFRYLVGGKYGYFGFADPKTAAAALEFPSVPVKQNRIGAMFEGSIAWGEKSDFTLGLDADILRTSRSLRCMRPYAADTDFALCDAETSGIFTVAPHWMLHTDVWTLRVGGLLDITSNDGWSLGLAPDVAFAWTPMQYFAFEAKATGGTKLNPLSQVYSISPYINGSMAYADTRVPYRFDGKLAFGPFLGGTVELFGGYAKADRALVATHSLLSDANGPLDQVNIKGWHLGVAAGYDNGKNIAVRASYENAPGGYDHAWLENPDRARHIVNASLKLRPLKPMLIDIDYTFRGGRSAYGYDTEAVNVLGLPYYTPVRTSMGCVSDLTVGVAWAIDKRLSVFARGMNLLGRNHALVGDRPARGTSVMVGAGYKF